MSNRRIATLILLALVLSTALPSLAEAGMLRGASLGDGDLAGPAGFLSRIAGWLSDLATAVERTFTATPGATMGSGG